MIADKPNPSPGAGLQPKSRKDAANATGPNPTLVQNDEHLLVKGHRPERGAARASGQAEEGRARGLRGGVPGGVTLHR